VDLVAEEAGLAVGEEVGWVAGEAEKAGEVMEEGSAEEEPANTNNHLQGCRLCTGLIQTDRTCCMSPETHRSDCQGRQGNTYSSR
jgi:hypothetical protein